MPQGICLLCDTPCDLRLSHILPKFIFRWLKKTSATEHLRLGETPNRRAQDGWKRHWLCPSCEALFSGWETSFAKRIFHPLSRERHNSFRYDQSLLRFCASVSWRVFHFLYERDSFEDYPEDIRSRINDAEMAWKEFLLGRRPSPEPFQQHLLLCDPIQTPVENLSPHINRYLMRSIEMDIVRAPNDRTVITYSKIGRFIIVGFLREERPGRWCGTKVDEQNGGIEPRKYDVPIGLLTYINARAQREAELHEMISDRQREKIDEAMWADPARLARSESLCAIEYDMRLFGLDAVTSSDKSRKDTR